MMAAALNIFLGVLLLVMQAVLAFTPHTTKQAGPCRCCACGSQACSVPHSSPAPAPTPLAAQRVASASEVAPLPAAEPLARPVPRTETFLRPALRSPGWAATQPLFRQHCALLI